MASETGSVMIEALVSAVLVGIMAVAFFGALNGSERVSSVGKLRAEAAALAQDDQERLRSMPVTALNNLKQSTPRSVAGVNFTVESKAEWIADKTKATDCTSNGAAADYLKITSTVTPTASSPLRPVAITSTVTPAPGSFNGMGALAVRVVDRNADPVAGVAVNVSGPATGAMFTDATGCAFFGYLPAGTTYSVTASKSTYVDPDGDPTPTVNSVTVNGQKVATVGFSYDVAGEANVTFVSKPWYADGTTSRGNVDSNQWELVMSNGSHTPARTFGPGYPTSVPNSSPWISTGALSAVDAPQLFPFTSAYGVYAGQDDCVLNSPAQNGVTDPGLLVPPGNLGLTYKQQLPALNVLGQVNGTPTGSLRVKITSDTPGCASWSIVRLTSAVSTPAPGIVGLLADPGVPYGTYDICVDNSPIVGTSNARRAMLANVPNTSLPGTTIASTTLNVITTTTKQTC
jgi:Tfp pilus assembly protein PilV